MGAWYLSLAASLALILIGMTVHWSVVLVGTLLLFVPVVSMLRTHRRERSGGSRNVAERDPQERQ